MRSRGSVTLEAAGTFILLLTIVIGVATAFDLLQQNMLLQNAVDQKLFDSGLKPLKLENNNGTLRESVNEPAIRRYLAVVQEQVRREIEQQGEAAAALLVEAAYAVIDIDEVNGKGARLHVFRQPTTGTYRPSPEEASTFDFEREFSKLAEEDEGVSRAAIPVSLSSNGRYLPHAVFVGVRVFSDIKNTFTGRTLQQLGKSPVLSAGKAIALRGDME